MVSGNHAEGLLESHNGTLIISTGGGGGGTSNEEEASLLLLPSDNSLLMPGYDVSPFDHSALADSTTVIEVNPMGENVSENQCSECQKSFPTYRAKSQHERLVHAKVSQRWDADIYLLCVATGPSAFVRDLSSKIC